MAYNPLDEYPQVRKVMYAAQWVINLVLGIAAIVLVTQDKSPEWFLITQAAFNFLWSYSGLTAQGNTPIGGVPGNPEPLQPDEAGYTGLINALIALVVLIVLVWLVVFLVRALAGA